MGRVNDAQPRLSEGILRVDRDRGAELLRGRLHALLAKLQIGTVSARVVLVRSEGQRLGLLYACDLAAGELDAQHVGEPGHDAVLQREDVVHHPVDLFAPETCQVHRVHEVGRDTDTLPKLLESAPDHPLCPDRASKLSGQISIDEPPLKRGLDAAARANVLTHDLDASDLVQICAHGFGNAR